MSQYLTLYTSQIETPIGPMLAGGNKEGIHLLEYEDVERVKLQKQRLSSLLDAEFVEGECNHFIELRTQLEEYFSKNRKDFSIPLVMNGTAFQKRVWNALLEIPYGQTRSYKQQSKALESPEAIRAIAHANGENRIAILIPCHRVIGADGSLTGYGGGLWRKQYLLELENAIQPGLGL